MSRTKGRILYLFIMTVLIIPLLTILILSHREVVINNPYTSTETKIIEDAICIHRTCYIVSRDGYTCYVGSREFAKVKSRFKRHLFRTNYTCEDGWKNE